jgi:hypothetical protein
MQELPPERRLRDAVDRIAHDRQADGRKVDPDLMRSAGLEADAQKGVLRELLLDLEVRDGVARPVGVQRLPRRVTPVPTDRCLDTPCPRARAGADKRQVRPLELAPLDEPLDSRVRLLRAGHDQQSRGVPVEPVHDPRTPLLPTRGPTVEHPVHERSCRVAGRRVDDDPSGLVDDKQVLVLVRDPQADVLRRQFAGRSAIGQLELDLLAAGQPSALRRLLTVQPDPADGK